MGQDVLHAVKRPNLVIEVYANRVTIKTRKLFGWDESNLPMRKISNVTVNKMKQTVVISTDDGKVHEHALGGLTAAQDLANAILQNI